MRNYFNSQFWFVVLLYMVIIGCRKDNPAPNPDPPVTYSRTNYNMLVGWWNSTSTFHNTGGSAYISPDRIYFGADQFYYQRIGTFSLGSSTGVWDSIPPDSLLNVELAGYGQGRIRLRMVLTKDSLVLTARDQSAVFRRFDSASLTRRPLSTIAGTGTKGFSGDGGPALAAQINLVTMFMNTGNQLLIVGDGRIRSIDLTTGIINTIAGNGSFNYSGDGGPALNAGILSSLGLAQDAAGNIYFSDWQNHVIRKIDASTGIVSRFAGTKSYYGSFGGDGGQALNATFNAPEKIVIDPAGKNLYVLDRMNRRIRKIDFGTGIISTVAGSGVWGDAGNGGQATAAELKTVGISMEPSGNLLLIENDYRIRRVNLSTGIISGVAGTGVKDYGGEGVTANSPIGDISSVCTDADGNIYFSEWLGFCRIRVISATDGKVYTVAGNGNCEYSGDGLYATAYGVGIPGNLTTDAQGNVYFSQGNVYFSEGTRIRKLSK